MQTVRINNSACRAMAELRVLGLHPQSYRSSQRVAQTTVYLTTSHMRSVKIRISKYSYILAYLGVRHYVLVTKNNFDS